MNNNLNKNRAADIPVAKDTYKGVALIDIDTSIFNYIKSNIIPTLYQNGNQIDLPVIYGNAERWSDVRINGYLRDSRGMIQIPLIMFTRNSIDQNESMPYFKDGDSGPALIKYSKTNRYTKFNIQNGVSPVYEFYNVSVPQYVTISYSIVVWTNYTEHMNQVLENFQYASNRYWGEDPVHKFFTRVDTLNTTQELTDESRNIRSEFTISVNAYILPNEYKNALTINKVLSSKKIITNEDTYSGNGAFILNENNNVIQKQKTVVGSYYSNNKIIINNINGVVSNPKYKVYINNIPIPINDVSTQYNDADKTLVFTLFSKIIYPTDTFFVNGIFI
jgi:hypothetical protein